MLAGQWMRQWWRHVELDVVCCCAAVLWVWGCCEQVVSVLEDFSNRRAVGKSRADYMDQVRHSKQSWSSSAGSAALALLDVEHFGCFP
jgi:hypothetical protein